MTFEEMPIFIVNQEACAKVLELRQFYRTEDSPAEIQVFKEASILPRLDSKYFLDMFWQVEPFSIPKVVLLEKEFFKDI